MSPNSGSSYILISFFFCWGSNIKEALQLQCEGMLSKQAAAVKAVSIMDV